MSKFFSEKYKTLVPYTPGEQPQNRSYIKLNTNESPFPPAPEVLKAVSAETLRLMLYSDPESAALREKMAAVYAVEADNVIMSNGSDEILNFAFMAFGDEENPLAFADITYGFYPVFAELNHIPYEIIPLTEDFSIDPKDYENLGKTIVIANPNAPTGKALDLSEIEAILKSNPDNVVMVDEAYVDFGGESAVPLTKKYENLLVIGTFSKSRSMAGARLGFAIGNRKLISDLNTIRYSVNPYNVNLMTSAAGIASLEKQDYYDHCCQIIKENRSWTEMKLKELGFHVLPSKANFLFVESDRIIGQQLYEKLKERGILVRHFTLERISNFNRITIGTMDQMEQMIKTIQEILEEEA